MKLTKNKKDELECILYFYSNPFIKEITDKDIENYFNLSEKGIKTKSLYDETRTKMDGLDHLKAARRWRGIHCDTSFDKDGNVSNRAIYEEGILDGSVPYFTLLGGNEKATTNIFRKVGNFFFPKYIRKYKITNLPIPRSVVNYLKKSLFKGMDAEKNVYKEIIKN